jgi:transcriptional regulator with XRE-family HTH domain
MRLRQERIAANLTQDELSQLAKVSQSAISKIESGYVPNLRFETLQRLAEALRRAGRKCDAASLSPTRQPTLLKGVRKRARRVRKVA